MTILTLLQLDDWVLCRIYNKKGTIENFDTRVKQPLDFQEVEERKPQITRPPPPPSLPPAAPLTNDFLHYETSDSVPRWHTSDSSGSEHPSPEFTCEKEVQSEAKWNNEEFEKGLDYEFNYMDAFLNDAFAPQFQYQEDQLLPLQDMFMHLPKHFWS